eukprot:6353721-Prymnesium_polylepis.1
MQHAYWQFWGLRREFPGFQEISRYLDIWVDLKAKDSNPKWWQDCPSTVDEAEGSAKGIL